MNMDIVTLAAMVTGLVTAGIISYYRFQHQAVLKQLEENLRRLREEEMERERLRLHGEDLQEAFERNNEAIRRNDEATLRARQQLEAYNKLLTEAVSLRPPNPIRVDGHVVSVWVDGQVVTPPQALNVASGQVSGGGGSDGSGVCYLPVPETLPAAGLVLSRIHCPECGCGTTTYQGDKYFCWSCSQYFTPAPESPAFVANPKRVIKL